MNQTRRARPLVILTVVILVIYAPIETWYSLPALWSPFYLVDFIGMVLLTWGAVRCWRAFFGRLEAVLDGGTLRLGAAELCFVGCGTALALIALVWSLRLATTRS